MNETFTPGRSDEPLALIKKGRPALLALPAPLFPSCPSFFRMVSSSSAKRLPPATWYSRGKTDEPAHFMKLMWRGVVSCIEQHGRLILGLMQKRLIPKWGLAIPRLEVKLTWKIVIILGHRYDNEVDILNEALEMYAFYSHECLESCVIGCKKRRAKAVALLKKGRSASADA